ncbi:MAG TPA: hypothetical protein DEF61_03170 [Firmicutes bacterium]|nr:hypothetical protein [Bacillota bacterium]HBX25256.1 hypothetical protein [Bacillota bacterium]
MKVTLLLLTLSSLGLLFSAGLKLNDSDVNAEEANSSMPANWSYQCLDEEGNIIDEPMMFASAYNDSKRGNSLKMSKMVSAYTLTCFSDSFIASKDTSYKLTFFYRSDCLNDDENRIVASVKEAKSDGTFSTSEVVSAKGRQDNWKQFSGYYSTSSDCESLTVSFSSVGMGYYFINGVSLVGKPAPTTFFNNYGIENTKEDQGSFSPFSSSYLSDDAYSGERSLKLSNQGFKTNFNELPEGEYELRFKYKHDFEDGSKLSIRMDCTVESQTGDSRLYYAPDVSADGTGGSWASYSFNFKKVNISAGSTFCSINYIKIFSYGSFLIDDLEIVGNDGFNYIVGGSFEGYDVSGLSLSGTTGIVKCDDGSFSFAGTKEGLFDNSDPLLTIDCSKLNLTNGNSYTLKYQYTGGWYGTALAYYGSDKIYTGSQNDNGWSDVSVSFTASEGKNIGIKFCESSSRFAYIRNISIVDIDNNEYNTSFIKEYSSSGEDGVESFPYGGFAYDFPISSEDSSSLTSNENESFSRESKDSGEEESSSWSQSSYFESISSEESSENIDTPNNGSSESDSTLIGVTIGLLAVSSIGLGVAIFALIRSKKHD